MNKAYFFDSYAIIETIKGNTNYQMYKSCEVIITKLNLFEIYFKLLKDFSESDANEFLSGSYNLAVDFDEIIIKLAAKFRLQNKSRNLSMVDCIGYILAKSLGLVFLTGDEQFKDIENVEYVK